MKYFSISGLLLSIVLLSCQSTNKEKVVEQNETTIATANDTSYVGRIEIAHKKEKFLSHKAIQFDFKLIFGSKERMNAKLTLLTNSTEGLLELNDSSKILYIHDKVYASDTTNPSSKIRFDAYTWAYFFLFPYKLSDDGTVWSDYTSEDSTNLFDTKKLSFESGIGDDPDDWYITHVDPSNHLIHHAAYIVTANKTREEAEKNPSAIQYLNYEEIEGVPLATEWVFWYWNAQEGLTKTKGEAQLINFKFVDVEDDFFSSDGLLEIK